MDKNNEKILSIFFDFPTRRFSVRELGRMIKMHPNVVSKVIKALVKKELITLRRFMVQG